LAISYLWVEHISSQPEKDINDTTIHEILHNFQKSAVNNCTSYCYECNEPAAAGVPNQTQTTTDSCIMSPNYQTHDGFIGLCLFHLLTGENNPGDFIDESLRRQTDPIGRGQQN